ncbi:hypothetical protein HAX54_005420 [Datura stramonium]|uniref:Uncharacterized protein n=1 Tax=Datura stramonium TaxID=4076 RepID=A0ABS8WXD3_DATST|nr:hypothetical protein [Datura stramonium]
MNCYELFNAKKEAKLVDYLPKPPLEKAKEVFATIRNKATKFSHKKKAEEELAREDFRDGEPLSKEWDSVYSKEMIRYCVMEWRGIWWVFVDCVVDVFVYATPSLSCEVSKEKRGRPKKGVEPVKETVLPRMDKNTKSNGGKLKTPIAANNGGSTACSSGSGYTTPTAM